ncbi:radical SAM protein [Anaerosporobacter faecicola]|uniref:radical SAM protein n=1 Tax=Anaerosporobacter faecicola TaxID=2718714 RepID=UPI00143BCA98|nr:radical SAM protein [Anaerosporobacter faecicola]
MNSRDCDFLLVSCTTLSSKKATYVYNNNKYDIQFTLPFSGAAAYLGSYVTQRGYTFDFINSFDEEKDMLKEKLKGNVKLVGITTKFVPELQKNALQLQQIVSFIRACNSKCEIVIGGLSFASLIQYETDSMRSLFMRIVGADYYINSFYGEESIVQLLNYKSGIGEISEVNNLFYKVKSNYLFTKQIVDYSNLEDNYIDWTVFKDRLGLQIPIRTAISCPFNCEYCSFPMYGGPYQVMSIRNIERELRTLAAVNPTALLQFIDDSFNVPLNRFKDILRMLIRNKFSFRWISYFRCIDTDDETIELMRQSGCIGVMLGIESGSQTVLHNMNKKVDHEKAKELIRKFRNAGILTYVFLLVGFPGETKQTIEETISFMNESCPTTYYMQMWNCQIGTPIDNKREQYKITGAEYNWKHYTMDSSTAQECIRYMRSKIQNTTDYLGDYAIFEFWYHFLRIGGKLDALKQIDIKLQ